MEPRFKKKERDKNPTHVLYRGEARKMSSGLLPRSGQGGRAQPFFCSSEDASAPAAFRSRLPACQSKGYPTLLWSELLYHSSTTRCPAILQRILNPRKETCLLALQIEQPRGGTTGPCSLEAGKAQVTFPLLGVQEDPQHSPLSSFSSGLQ